MSVSSKLFDPLGLLSPITIQLKLLFQLICSDRISWDQEIRDSISDKWLKLLRQLRTLNKLVILRQNIKVIKDKILSIELHGFCDCFVRAYGSLVYLRILTLNGCFVSLLSGKPKVASMKSKLMNSVKAAINPVWGV